MQATQFMISKKKRRKRGKIKNKISEIKIWNHIFHFTYISGWNKGKREKIKWIFITFYFIAFKCFLLFLSEFFFFLFCGWSKINSNVEHTVKPLSTILYISDWRRVEKKRNKSLFYFKLLAEFSLLSIFLKLYNFVWNFFRVFPFHWKCVVLEKYFLCLYIFAISIKSGSKWRAIKISHVSHP